MPLAELLQDVFSSKFVACYALIYVDMPCHAIKHFCRTTQANFQLDYIRGKKSPGRRRLCLS